MYMILSVDKPGIADSNHWMIDDLGFEVCIIQWSYLTRHCVLLSHMIGFIWCCHKMHRFDIERGCTY